MLDQCALELQDVGAAQHVFNSGTATIYEARQAIAARKMSRGWLPYRLTASACALNPLARWSHPAFREPDYVTDERLAGVIEARFP